MTGLQAYARPAFFYDVISLHVVNLFLFFFFYGLWYFSRYDLCSTFHDFFCLILLIFYSPHVFEKKLKEISRQCTGGVLLLCRNYQSIIFFIRNTTPLNSFTDGLIPSVSGMKVVGEIITDGLTDGTRPSV